MEAPNFIVTQWEEQRHLFSRNLEIIRHKPGRKAVHDIRVSVKKLRSYLLAGAGDSEKKVPPSFHSIKQFFRISGRSRDLEMSLSLLQKNFRETSDQIPSFKKYLRSYFSLARNRTKAAAAEHFGNDLDSCSVWLRNQLAEVNDEDMAHRIGVLSTQKLNEVNEFRKQFREQVHRIRKHLKLLGYWLKACPQNPVFNRSQMKILDRALTALGKWQDQFVLGKKLKDFRKDYLVKGTAEFEQAKKLEQAIKSAKQELLREAEERTGELLKKE